MNKANNNFLHPYNITSLIRSISIIFFLVFIWSLLGCQKGVYEIDTYENQMARKLRKKQSLSTINCFPPSELRKIGRHSYRGEWGKRKTKLYIHKYIVKDSLCIGLYQFDRMDLAGEFIVYYSTLKFENKFYISHIMSSKKRQSVLNRFEEKYQSLFSKEEIKKIKEEFLSEPLILDELEYI